MRVQVEILCAPHPVAEIEESLRRAGRQLASRVESVSVEIREGPRITAVLEFEMRRAAQYKVVDGIAATVQNWVGACYQDITIRFPKD